MTNLMLTPKTKALSSEGKARCEVAMMNGRVLPVTNEALNEVLKYCIPVIAPHIRDVESLAKETVNTVLHEYTQTERECIGICFNRVQGMPMITFILNDEDMPVTYQDLEYGAYAFTYVLNLDFIYCSEFGDCYFQNERRLS